MNLETPCLFCRRSPCTCDGRQGRVEAAINALDDARDDADLDDVCENYHGGQARSVDANADVAPRKHTQRERCKAAIDGEGLAGLTVDQVERVVGLSHQSASARCSELKRDGLIVPSGRTRPTAQGSQADVLISARVAQLHKIGPYAAGEATT